MNDFNGDGFPDILIGSPGVDVGTSDGAGEATVIYSKPSGPPVGIYTMPTPSGFPFPIKSTGEFIPATNFLGEVAGAMTGYSVGFTGQLITADATPRILVGAPGLNSLQGAAYAIPSAATPRNTTTGFANKLGDIFLNQAIGVDTLRITMSTPGGVPAQSPPFFALGFGEIERVRANDGR